MLSDDSLTDSNEKQCNWVKNKWGNFVISVIEVNWCAKKQHNNILFSDLPLISNSLWLDHIFSMTDFYSLDLISLKVKRGYTDIPHFIVPHYTSQTLHFFNWRFVASLVWASLWERLFQQLTSCVCVTYW